jgi:hypothetical protein
MWGTPPDVIYIVSGSWTKPVHLLRSRALFSNYGWVWMSYALRSGVDGKIAKDEGQMRSLDIAEKGTMELADGFLRLRWRTGATVGVNEAQAALAAIDALGQGASLPMLIHVQGVNFSRAARRIFPSPSQVSRIALLGSSPVDYVIALFVLRVVPLPFPVRYFTSSQEAITWLRKCRG